MPPTDSGETDSHCGARDVWSRKRGAVCVCEEGAHRGPLARLRALLLPFFSSSSSSTSAATFVSTSSSRSYLLETFVDLTSPLLRPLWRGFDGVVQSAMSCTRASSGCINSWALASRVHRGLAYRRGGRLRRKLLDRRRRLAAARDQRRWVNWGGVLGAVDQVGLALALGLAEQGGGLPLVDALRQTNKVTGSTHKDSPVSPQYTRERCWEALTAGTGEYSSGNSLDETNRLASPYASEVGWGQGVGRQTLARRMPGALPPETP